MRPKLTRKDKKLCASFGARLQEMRFFAKATQEDISFKTGIGTNSISKIENGEVNPSLVTIGKLAKFFDVSIQELMKGIKY